MIENQLLNEMTHNLQYQISVYEKLCFELTK